MSATRSYTVTHNATGKVEYIEAANVGQVERYLAQRDFTVKPTKNAELLAAIRSGATISVAKVAVEPQSGDLPLAEVVAETEER